MLRSLVSPMFLEELKKGNTKKKTAPVAPLPDGYSFLKRGGSSVFVYHGKTIISKVESLNEVADAVRFHQEMSVRQQGKNNFTIRRLSAFRWHVMLDGIFQVSKSSEKAALSFVEKNS